MFITNVEIEHFKINENCKYELNKIDGKRNNA